MFEKILRKSWLFLLLLVAGSLLITGGCHRKKASPSDREAALPGVNKVVIVGFRAAMSEGDKPYEVRDPSSGTIIIAAPVSSGVVRKMTDNLFERMKADKKYELVSPGQAKGVFSSIVSSDKEVGMEYLRVLQKVGKTFRADAALGGTIYRWREREGSAAGVNRPASVAFDLQLVRPADGVVLWRDKFDKTQRSLSENLFDAGTFVQGRGRWMTAGELALLGLRKMLAGMPGGQATAKTE